MVFWLQAFALQGCAGPPEVQVLDAPEARPALVEALYAGEVGSAAPLDGFQVVAQLDGALAVLEPGGSTTLRSVGPAVLDAVRLDDGALIATDEALYWLEDYLQDAAFGALLGPVSALDASDGDLWLGADGLYLWRKDALSELTLNGKLSGPFAAGGQIEGQPVVWASGPQGVFALSEAEDWTPVAALELEASSVAVSAEAAWISANGLVYRHDGEGWSGFELPGAVQAVWANPADPRAWLLTDSAIYGFDGDFFELTGLPEEELLAAGTDALGRLLLASEEGLYRVSPEREVAIVGFYDGAALGGTTAVRLYPNLPDATLTVEVDGIPIEIIDGEALVDPYEFIDEDQHRLTATARWEDGGEATSALNFTIGAPESATWSGEIEPLYTEQCATCHGGSTETVLDTSAAWTTRIEAILTEVNAGRMPLGGPALSQAQIALIRVWRDGGFQE